MPAYLSGQTKVFQAYGRKRNTHTTNVRRVSPFDWDAQGEPSERSTNNNPRPKASSSSESETDYDEPPAAPTRQAKVPTPVKRKDACEKRGVVSARAPAADQENVSPAATAVAKGSKNAAPISAALERVSRVDTKGKGKEVVKEAAPLALKKSALAVKRPNGAKFLGVFVDVPARVARSAPAPKPKTVAPQISVEPEEDVAETALEADLNDKFGDLDLSDDDGDDQAESDAAPSNARRSGSSFEPKLVTYANRKNRRVAEVAVESSSEDDTSAIEVAPPARKSLAQPGRTRANSRAQAAPAVVVTCTPPKRATTAARQRKPTAISPLAFPALLKPLLAITSAGSPPKAAFEFADFVASPPAPLAPSSNASRWRKVGEASFSEVFAVPSAKGGDLVVKAIPVSPWAAGKAPAPKKNDSDLPLMSDWEAAEREVGLSSLLGGEERAVEGFVRFKGAFLVQGSYPTELLAAWDTFKKAQSPPCDDQIRPHVLPREQVYILIVLEHGGRDLESFKLRSWVEAASVLWQVASVCARAEEAVQFEHRDLHWGNVLVSSSEGQLAGAMDNLSLTPRKASGGESLSIAKLESASSGVQVTLIDFTLSRATDPTDGIVFDAFDDELLFEGEGDSQFDVYRSMRDHVKGDWEGFHPLTNVMWIHHLATKLLKHKKLKPPTLAPSRLAATHLHSSPLAASPIRRGASARSGAKAAFSATPKKRGLTKLAVPANSALELQAWKLLQDVATKLGESVVKVKGGKGKKGARKAPGVGSAGEVCEWWAAQAASRAD